MTITQSVITTVPDAKLRLGRRDHYVIRQSMIAGFFICDGSIGLFNGHPVSGVVELCLAGWLWWHVRKKALSEPATTVVNVVKARR